MSAQLDVFAQRSERVRLTGQRHRVWTFLRDGKWWTYRELQTAIMHRFNHYDSEAAISARIRDFRKPKYGGHTVERRLRQKPGLYEFKVVA